MAKSRASQSVSQPAVAAMPAPEGRRSTLRGVLVVAAALGAAFWWVATPAEDAVSDAFVGAGAPSAESLGRTDSRVAMGIKSGRYQNGIPNLKVMMSRKVQMPSLNNMKDQYFILFVRSQKVRNWYPMNIISGADAIKTLKGIKDNNFVKALGGDRLAENQILRAIGMNIYGQKDKVVQEARKMHTNLQFSSELDFGFKEITNNTRFNDNPREFMMLNNITAVPPEAELRNLLDDAGDALKDAGESVSKVGDNIKGFLSGNS